ncbi:MAG: hypothetical protein ACRCUJ_05535 [Phocaeicola sp.]
MQQTEEQTPYNTTFERFIIRAARILSRLFSPFMIPLIAFFSLFFFTYLRVLPLSYKLMVLGLVYSFTVLMPMLGIYLHHKVNGLSLKILGKREKRIMPYLLTIISYSACLLTMYRLQLPRYITGIVMAALICIVCCLIINFWWKISTRVTSGGLMVGGLLSFSFLFQFNPVWWLAAFIFLSGCLGSARIILKEQSLVEIFVGFVVGLLCGILGILFI